MTPNSVAFTLNFLVIYHQLFRTRLFRRIRQSTDRNTLHFKWTRTKVCDLTLLLSYLTYNHCYFKNQCFLPYCSSLRRNSLFKHFTLTRLFRNPLLRTFFHSPWDFEITGFDCPTNPYDDLLRLPCLVGLLAQVVRALHRYRRSHGFESRAFLNFWGFILFSQLL